MSKASRKTIIQGVAIFILLPILLGVLMYFMMVSVLRDHMEEQVTSQSRVLGQLALRRISVRLTEMDVVAGYLENSGLPPEEMGPVAYRLLEHPSRVSMGIMPLQGEALSGATLPLSEYPAVRNAFRGADNVRFREGEGLLLTAPVYHNGNVRYVVYQFFDPTTLFEGFGVNAFEGQAALMLVDSGQRISVPITDGGLTESSEYFQDPAVKAAIAELSDRLNTDHTAAVYCAGTGAHKEQVFIFVSVLGQTGMYLLGIVPHEVVAGGLSSLSGMAVLVFALLLALLTIGTFRVVSADARARESDELRRAKQIAEEASESRGRFLSSMSHELRTPINTIMGMNEMILRETGEEVTRERAIDIKSASQILLGLINDVLDFSKIESGRLSIIPADYDLVSMIRDLVLLSENRAMAKSLEFQLRIDPALPVGLRGDDIRIRQVVANLLTNAVKYTPEGTVTLRMSGRYIDGDRLILHCEVTDTGIGIKPDDVERLLRLDPFTRVDEVRNRAVEGSGLGLPIIVNLLRLMGTELHIESEYGHGSTFSFDLEQTVVDTEPIGDIRRRLDASAKEYEYRVTCCAPRAKVLVVDDNAMNRKIFTALLGPTKIQVTSVSGGAKCLELVSRERFDLIFMDHLMPEMDGVEALHRLRALENSPCRNVPVVALTANAFSGAQEKYLELGFDAFLAKPIVPEKLESMLCELLPKDLLETPPADAPRSAPAHRPTPQPEPEEPELPLIDGVNWEMAKLHLNDHALLLETMSDFCRILGSERASIAELAKHIGTEEGLTAYRIKVHSLKSSAAMVGVLGVSELARLLETAARSGETERVELLNPVLLETMQTMEGRLSPYFAKPEEKREPLTDPEALAGLLETLKGALEGMDITLADSVMGQLNGYSYEPEVQPRMDELAASEAALDFDAALKTVESLLEKLEQ